MYHIAFLSYNDHSIKLIISLLLSVNKDILLTIGDHVFPLVSADQILSLSTDHLYTIKESWRIHSADRTQYVPIIKPYTMNRIDRIDDYLNVLSNVYRICVFPWGGYFNYQYITIIFHDNEVYREFISGKGIDSELISSYSVCDVFSDGAHTLIFEENELTQKSIWDACESECPVVIYNEYGEELRELLDIYGRSISGCEIIDTITLNNSSQEIRHSIYLPHSREAFLNLFSLQNLGFQGLLAATPFGLYKNYMDVMQKFISTDWDLYRIPEILRAGNWFYISSRRSVDCSYSMFTSIDSAKIRTVLKGASLVHCI